MIGGDRTLELFAKQYATMKVKRRTRGPAKTTRVLHTSSTSPKVSGGMPAGVASKRRWQGIALYVLSDELALAACSCFPL